MKLYIFSVGLLASLFASCASGQESSSAKGRQLVLINHSPSTLIGVDLQNINTGKTTPISFAEQGMVKSGQEIDMNFEPPDNGEPPCLYTLTLHFEGAAPMEISAQNLCTGSLVEIPFSVIDHA